MPALSASAPNTLYQFSPYGSLKPMKPTVFTPFFTMCLISAAAIRSSFCVVLNTQRRLRVERLDHRRRADRRHQRHLALGDDVEDRERVRRRRRADQRVDVVFLDQLLDVLHRARRVAAVVELDVLDRGVADLLRQQRRRCSSAGCRWPTWARSPTP